MHFGFPCKTWGPLARMNGSTRSTTTSDGFPPPSEKDRIANLEARVVAGLFRTLSLMIFCGQLRIQGVPIVFMFLPSVTCCLCLLLVMCISISACMGSALPPGSLPNESEKVQPFGLTFQSFRSFPEFVIIVMNIRGPLAQHKLGYSVCPTQHTLALIRQHYVKRWPARWFPNGFLRSTWPAESAYQASSFG